MIFTLDCNMVMGLVAFDVELLVDSLDVVQQLGPLLHGLAIN